ncbi:MAG: substrate-binding domain-containing protein, partial [Agathobacter sp.]|nr:substrate-binding domain-containing protein [Agathobacter sp.]
MKKVALIADCWRKLINFAWISGCRRYIAEHNLDVNLYVFSSFGNFSKDEKFNEGEYNIFNLPNLSEFDGIIVDFTNIEMEGTKDWIIRKVREANVPVVSLAESIDGMYLSSIDDYSIMKKMIEHVVDVHGCKKINFVGGPSRNDEARLRLKAYRDVMMERGFAYTEDQIYCGNYEMSTGEEAFRNSYEKGIIPEA